MAIRLARLATDRKGLVTFTDSYHGWSDATTVRMSRDRTVPLAPGILNEYTVQLRHDCLESLGWIGRNARTIAAVVIEPIQSRRADLHPRIFLKALRKITEEHGIVLVFDEVVTGFRLHQGGAQRYWNIRADLATYGKVWPHPAIPPTPENGVFATTKSPWRLAIHSATRRAWAWGCHSAVWGVGS